MRRAQPTPPKRKMASKVPKGQPASERSVDRRPDRQPTDDMDDLNIVPDEFMPEWNYTIFPRTKK